ncbi:MAG: proline dehydrogenase family protein [Halobacteriaceae archaeon]
MLPPVARRFVAGETAAEAFERAAANDRRGVGTIINRLGEHYRDRASADADAAAYRTLVRDAATTDLPVCVSVKPSQVGLAVDEATFHELVDDVAAAAADAGVFLWLDMEGHESTDATLDAYERLARRHGGGVGVCVQANLRRTRADLERLAGLPGKVRLVKGAYDEPPALAHRDRAAVDRNYRTCLAYAFRAFEGSIAVGSHDPRMLSLAEQLHERYGTPYEVQMLMGVREDAQYALARDRPVWQYVPYGPAWLAYFGRRVAERRENLAFALRAVLRG